MSIAKKPDANNLVLLPVKAEPLTRKAVALAETKLEETQKRLGKIIDEIRHNNQNDKPGAGEIEADMEDLIKQKISCEKEKAEIKALLKEHVIVEDTFPRLEGSVCLGSLVGLNFSGESETQLCAVVSPGELVIYTNERLEIEFLTTIAPLAEKLIGKRVGDKVDHNGTTIIIVSIGNWADWK